MCFWFVCVRCVYVVYGEYGYMCVHVVYGVGCVCSVCYEYVAGIRCERVRV